LNIVHVS